VTGDVAAASAIRDGANAGRVLDDPWTETPLQLRLVLQLAFLLASTSFRENFEYHGAYIKM